MDIKPSYLEVSTKEQGRALGLQQPCSSGFESCLLHLLALTWQVTAPL